MHPALRLYGWLALAVCLFLFTLAGIARAHEFYEKWCCNGEDCKPYTKEVRETPDGYYLPDYDVTIPYRDAYGTEKYASEAGTRYEVPKDHGTQYHACIMPWEPTKIRCFYAKPGGV